MNRSLIIFTLLIIFLTVLVSVAQAKTRLTIDLESVNMGIVAVSDYENGYKEKLPGNILNLRSDKLDWKLWVKTNDNNMGVIGDYTKPISDFYWKAEGDYATQTIYTSITNYDIEAASGAKSSRERQVPIDYKILLSWSNDVPGNYNLTIVYTLTTQ